MRVAIHLAHPAHYHLFKHVAEALCSSHEVLVTYNEKDVLAQLIRRRELGHASTSVGSTKGRGAAGLLRQFLQKEVGLFRAMRKYRPNIMLGTSIIIAHVGRILRIPSVIVNEDDFDVVAGTARIGYPFASHLLAPACCRVGRWAHKVIAYDSYHELAYLGPSHFTPDPARIAALGSGTEPFFILRFAGLSAHHDFGKSGIGVDVARRLIGMLEAHGRIYITSERALEAVLEPYRIQLDPLDMHHALAHATLYIGDSQTMTAEAAVLGTPALRFNDFVGRLSYLEELEHRYGLTYGIPASQPERLYARVEELLQRPDLKEEWARRRQRMLSEKIDLAAFLVWFIAQYPQSVQAMRSYDEALQRFRWRVSTAGA